MDPQVCLASGGLASIDQIVLMRLSRRVNVVPILAKADTMTIKQLDRVKKMVMVGRGLIWDYYYNVCI